MSFFKAVLIGLAVTIAYLIFNWSGIAIQILAPLTKESSLYRELTEGLLIVFIFVPICAVVSATLAFIAAKTKRLQSAFIAFTVFLVSVGMAFTAERAANRFKVRAHFEEQRKEALAKPSQESQKLPLLDPARPITILNQIGLSSKIVIAAGAPYLVRASVRDQVTLHDNTVLCQIMVFVPGSIVRKIIGSAKLHPTGVRSDNGQFIFEGSVSYENSLGATEAFLSVVGKDDIFDVVSVLLR